MEQQNTGFTLEGKRKFIVTLCSIAASLVGLFLTPESAEGAVQVIMVAGPLVLGLLYDWMQSRIDTKKKEVELKREERFTVEAQAAQSPTLNGSSQTPQTVQVVAAAPFDVQSFHDKVLEEVGQKYTEENPCTIFYLARDKGMVAPCSDVAQAQDYWDYLVVLAKQANDWLEEMTKKEGPCSKQSPAFYAINREYNRTVNKRNCLDAVAAQHINWKLKLDTHHHTLYYLGELSGELLKYPGN